MSADTRDLATSDRFPGEVRRARKEHRCVGADRLYGYDVVGVYNDGTAWTKRFFTDRDRALAAHEEMLDGVADRAGRRYDEVTIEERPNPNHRPECEWIIQPGTLYVEYLGETPAYQSGDRYCRTCALAAFPGDVTDT